MNIDSVITYLYWFEAVRRHFPFFLHFWEAENDEVRDAVLVTDGDNDIGQVCYATNSHVHASCIFVAN